MAGIGLDYNSANLKPFFLENASLEPMALSVLPFHGHFDIKECQSSNLGILSSCVMQIIIFELGTGISMNKFRRRGRCHFSKTCPAGRQGAFLSAS